MLSSVSISELWGVFFFIREHCNCWLRLKTALHSAIPRNPPWPLRSARNTASLMKQDGGTLRVYNGNNRLAGELEWRSLCVSLWRIKRPLNCLVQQRPFSKVEHLVHWLWFGAGYNEGEFVLFFSFLFVESTSTFFAAAPEFVKWFAFRTTSYK